MERPLKLPLKVKLFVYFSHSLSAWGDRMWSFGVGLFLVIINPGSLLVTAVYGFSRCVSVLLFGALVGDWIDRTARLTAARVSLIIQNLCVVLCATVVFFVVTYKPTIEGAWPNKGMLYLSYAVIIVIAVIANLASMGNKIAIQKDWIVEMCQGDKDLLANMSATMRRIDLTTQILAPIVSGQIMYFGSPGIGALFIAVWNLVSVFIEYYLLWKVYDIIPALQVEKGSKDTEIMAEPGDDEEERDIELQVMSTKQALDEDEENKPLNELEDQDQSAETSTQKNPQQSSKSDEKSREGCCSKMCSRFLILGRGWKIYMSYDVAFAGLGLACLYLTVLGFDSITVGYAYSQCVNESIMGVLMAAGGLFGILGTFLFPIIRKRVGLERTGLVGLFLEVAFLSLCVASVWSPGSPFDPFYWTREPVFSSHVTNSSHMTNVSLAENMTHTSYSVYDVSDSNQSGNVTVSVSMTTNTSQIAMTTTGSPVIGQKQKMDYGCDDGRSWTEFISVGLLMAGIIGARCGLWLADLTITQLFLENVKETQRGVVNGVQGSLNMLMDMLKFIMVIVAPQPQVYGILIIISFSAVVLGWASYAKYSRSKRGHLFHFDRVKNCVTSENNNTVPQTEET